VSLKRFAAIYVACTAIACLTVMWALFVRMVATGSWRVTIRANDFQEGWPEALLLTLAVVLLPPVVYWVDAYTR